MFTLTNLCKSLMVSIISGLLGFSIAFAIEMKYGLESLIAMFPIITISALIVLFIVIFLMHTDSDVLILHEKDLEEETSTAKENPTDK